MNCEIKERYVSPLTDIVESYLKMKESNGIRPISRSYHTRNEWTHMHMYRDVSKRIEAYAFTLVEMPTFLYVRSTQTD